MNSSGWILPTVQQKSTNFKKAKKIDDIFTVDLTLWSMCQFDGEDFVNFVPFLEKTSFTGKDGGVILIPFHAAN